jgi:hypothetical protein
MTTIFENETSRAVEDAALRCLARAWSITRSRRMPDFSGADFAIESPDGQAVVEIKGRSRTFIGANTVEIAIKKIDDLRALSERHGCRALLVFVFLADRSIYYIDAAAVVRTLAWTYVGGRRPRAGSANDQEPMVMIPVGMLTPVGESIDGGVANAAIEYNLAHRT